MFRRWICAAMAMVLMLSLATAASAETQYAVVSTPTADGSAYLRSTAGAGQPVVGSARNGDQLIVLKRGNTWHRVQVVRTGKSGWMYGRYVRFTGGGSDVNREGVVSSKAGYANFRTGAGTDSRVIARLDDGAKLQVISRTGSWYYVYSRGRDQYGYVSVGLVSLTSGAPQGLPGNEAVVSSSDGFANLRRGAGMSYGVVAALNNGTRVEITGASGNWSRVNVPATNQYGYVYTKLLNRSGAGAGSTSAVRQTGRIQSSDGFANFRTGAGMNHSVTSRLDNGVLVSVLGSEGNWYRVQLDGAGSVGYVHNSLLQKLDALAARVTTGDVNLRAGPGTSYDRLTVVRAGTAVSVLEYSGNFARVNADGWIGYVSQNYLK